MKHDVSQETGASAPTTKPSVLHSYHDFATASPPTPGGDPERGGTTFPLRLHHMLSQVEMGGLSHIVSWQPHGRCFIVHRQEDFVHQVLPMYVCSSTACYVATISLDLCAISCIPADFVPHPSSRFFRQTRMASFQRQLNLYGFQRLTAGKY